LCDAADEAAELPLWVNNGYGGRSTGTSVVPQVADDFGAPRKSAEVGHEETLPRRPKSVWLSRARFDPRSARVARQAGPGCRRGSVNAFYERDHFSEEEIAGITHESGTYEEYSQIAAEREQAMHGKFISIFICGFITFALSSSAILYGSEAHAQECPSGSYNGPNGKCIRMPAPPTGKLTTKKIAPIRKKARRK
jgi:hypothetical protein